MKRGHFSIFTYLLADNGLVKQHTKAMKYLLTTGLFLVPALLYSQVVNHYERPAEGEIELTEGIAISKIKPGYTLWLPEDGSPLGMVVWTHARRDTVHPDAFIETALNHRLAVLYLCTENRLDFYFDDQSMLEVEQYIHDVVTTYAVPPDKLFYCGMSLGGTRVLKLAIFGQSESSKYKLKPRAIAICDSPLDMIRFHREMVRARELKFNEITENEGRWVSGYLEANLGGAPGTAKQAYIDYSPYCHSADGGTHLDKLTDIAILAYTEPDVNWWIEHRRKDYYSMNAVDLAALINELKIRGNEDARLITTQDKGYHPDGSRHPHSWSIVDEAELIGWFADWTTED